MKSKGKNDKYEGPEAMFPLAADSFDSDTFSFPSEEQADIPSLTFIDPEGGFILFSTLQS